MGTAAPEPRPGRGTILAIALAAVVAAGAAASACGPGRATEVPALPGPTSAEAGFARDMQVHHLQGVDMAMLVRDRSSDPDIRGLAYDMATTQMHQAGQLYGWLAAWGLHQLGEPPMTWMGHAGHDMGALMAGMATPEQMAELSAASGVEAERVFLRLMITHHQGALEMSEAVLARSALPVVVAFARAVLLSQQSEIDLMTRLLEERVEEHSP